MSRNGSGTYNLPAGNPVTTGTTISSTWANSTLSDIATALTQSIAYDGQTTPIANLPMGTYAHTNVGNATARTMYASAAQVEDGTLNYLTSVSGTNAITATAPVSMSAYVAGQTFRFIAAGANTGAVTLNLNAIGAKAVVRTDGSALVSGDIASGAAVQVFYDGTNFQLLNDANGQSETVTTLTATTKVVTPQVGSSSGSFTIQSANTTAITIDSSQNVGIGTSSPTEKVAIKTTSINGFSVSGNITSTPASLDAGQLQLITLNSPLGGTTFNAGDGRLITFGVAPSTAYPYIRATGLQYLVDNNHLFYTANTERMRIDSSGNVGIGTSSPSAKLNVVGNSSNIVATFDKGAANQAAIQLKNSAQTYSNYVDINNNGTNWWSLYDTTNAVLMDVYVPGASAYRAFYTTGTERMRIDSSGNVGIGTSSPLTRLHVVGASNTGSGILVTNQGTNVAVLANEATWLGTGTSNNAVVSSFGATALLLGTNGAERMRIDSSGSVIVGATATGAYFDGNLNVFKSGNIPLCVKIDTVSAWDISCWSTPTSGNNAFLNFGTEGTFTSRGSITYNRLGGLTAYNTTSDQRLKENIVDAGSGLDKLSKVQIRSFDWKETGNNVDFGVIAQELNEVAPECVTPGEDNEDGSIKNPWAVDTSALVPAMIKAIQELSAKVTALEAQLGAK